MQIAAAFFGKYNQEFQGGLLFTKCVSRRFLAPFRNIPNFHIVISVATAAIFPFSFLFVWHAIRHSSVTTKSPAAVLRLSKYNSDQSPSTSRRAFVYYFFNLLRAFLNVSSTAASSKLLKHSFLSLFPSLLSSSFVVVVGCGQYFPANNGLWLSISMAKISPALLRGLVRR